ncbi:MAG: alpha/beta fold hydrolase, partial [Gammaproteobacteria bacterium]
MATPDIYRIPGFTTQGGITLDVDIAYCTFGTLSAARDNAVLIPTFYGGRHAETAFMFAPGRAIDPQRHFVIVANMLGNGASTSPSTTPAPYGRGNFPLTTIHDNVACQHRLVTAHLGIDRLRLVSGFSMGAAQTFEWGALHADMVDAIAPICGAARVADHNRVFVASAVDALRLDAEFRDGWYAHPPLR